MRHVIDAKQNLCLKPDKNYNDEMICDHGPCEGLNFNKVTYAN